MEVGTGRPTVDLHDILQRIQGERNSQRRNPKSEDRERSPKESSNMGSIPRERVTLLPRMSMGERRTEA
jgi:hypothetical protein